jgi:hypothetical protein
VCRMALGTRLDWGDCTYPTMPALRPRASSARALLAAVNMGGPAVPWLLTLLLWAWVPCLCPGPAVSC